MTCGRPAMYGVTHAGCHRRFGLDGHLSVTLYNGVMEHILEYYKRRGVFSLEEQLAEVFARYFFDVSDFVFDLLESPTVVPIPQFKYESFLRPYNVSERLAAMFANQTGLIMKADVLYKSRPTIPQKHLSREKRLKNLRGVFSVPHQALVRGQDMILVDDVWTTGATLRECTRTLKHAGARKVWAVTLCRGI